MTTQIAIDESLLQEAMQMTHTQSARETVENALRFFIKSRTQTLSEFLEQSPLSGLELDLQRDNDTGRNIDV